MDLIVSLLPIVFLIFIMTKKNSVPSRRALPVTAVLMYFLSLIFLKQEPIQTNAAVIDGLLTALTPISIITGAIFLFKTMEKTGAMDVIRDWLNGISSNKVAQLMIIGWAFSFMIEGASGFGTPAALAAPILVGLGFSPLSAALFTLILNSVPVSFGAVGTPTWFGLSEIANLSLIEISEIGMKSAIIHSVAALIIPIIALKFVLDWKSIKKNWLFIYMSIVATIIPYLIVASFNYEFPSLLGGFTGLLFTILAAKKGWGLRSEEESEYKGKTHSTKTIVKSLFPLWGTLVVLVFTRVPFLGIKALLNMAEPSISLELGNLGIFSISSSLILKLNKIIGTEAVWDYKMLYVPSLIPFILISIVTFLVFKTKKEVIRSIIGETAHQMDSPVRALLGALVFVNLIMLGGENSPAMIIGGGLSRAFGWGWTFFAAYLGALGAFFSGSNTVSNLTFGGIQDSIASGLNLNRTTILAAQSVGGAMGNMVCINNIVAVCSVLGLVNSEGKILKKTVIPMAVYGVIAGFVSMLF
jgi:lactate permease